MHISFIPYGKRSEVELLLRDMEAQKHKLILTKGINKKIIWIQGQLRVLPGGIYEYCFPKEDKDMVLTTLNFNELHSHYIGELKLKLIRKIFGYKKASKFNSNKKYLWIKDNVSIIPIGIKEDNNFTEPNGENEGWQHEGI